MARIAVRADSSSKLSRIVASVVVVVVVLVSTKRFGWEICIPFQAGGQDVREVDRLG